MHVDQLSVGQKVFDQKMWNRKNVSMQIGLFFMNGTTATSLHRFIAKAIYFHFRKMTPAYCRLSIYEYLHNF
jgi:hypothetical protein